VLLLVVWGTWEKRGTDVRIAIAKVVVVFIENIGCTLKALGCPIILENRTSQT
jgi:hypothetical protein